MHELGLTRLYLLRAMYLFIAVGLGINFWPGLIYPPPTASGPGTVVQALLGTLALLAALGVRYPVRLLPLLIFELIWKLVWVIAYGWPAWRAGHMDAYASGTLFACMIGIVLVPLALPWRYVCRTFALERGDRWLRSSDASQTGERPVVSPGRNG
ncbi:hypothetical protein CXB49_06345 [Chromobacterium sp. ATCC 53434]|uniref:hypothetical protein n=1 Tax=Chromobacterium TaxID=535 RepID=UPI000C787639|nr:hypothetical protein [Chromobacterium sp. ATCC 53434]AUH50454.1 hypothetical protein CXB49_06345 [Chromobacterium sp. ATCC 53434]